MFTMLVAVWRSGNVFGHIIEVTLHQARLVVDGWPYMGG